MKLKIKQAVKSGYIECKNFGVADLSYPTSTKRRGRCQKYKSDEIGGTCAPALTCTDSALYRIECYEDDNMNLKVVDLLNEEKCVRIMDQDTGKKYRIAIRKLIPEECFELQGMTDDDVAKARAMGLSDSALYKIAGNGLTSTCVQFIAESLYKSVIDKGFKTTWEKMVDIYGTV